MARRFRPLAAAIPTDKRGTSMAGLERQLQKRHRVGVPAACELCRKKKSRCDGQRPSCERCRTEGTECSYATAEGETHQTALKRKYQGVAEENRQLRELFSLIHERPAVEASEIYRRIRDSDDPLEVLQLVKQADLLLQPFSRQQSSGTPGLQQIKEGLLADTLIQLPVRPWSVAATDRIVPEMMTNLFLKRSILSRALEERLKNDGDLFDAMSIDVI